MEIQRDEEELVPSFNLRFMKAVKDILEYLIPNDAKCLIVYLGAFDNKMSYLIRDKEPKTLQQEYHIAMDIENTMKYSMMKGYMVASVCCLDAHHEDDINNDEKDD